MKIIGIVVIAILALSVILYFAFKKKKGNKVFATGNISYSQVDMTERFGDNLKLKSDEWIDTVPINKGISKPESMGLPPLNADQNQIYEIAAKLSRLREQIPIPNDSVYCPICHIANIDINKLHTPCPKCKRKLLKFGWD
ncbi:MAG: hypothetical protein WAX69_13060 [Victivallales bacterium]